MRRALLILLGLSLAACEANRSDDDQILGTLERDRLELTAEASERITQILVREGDAVAADAELLQLDAGAMQARLDQAEAARTVAERRLAELVKGPRAQQIVEARAATEAARSAVATETSEYRRVRDLVERKLQSQSALDQARSRRDAAVSVERQAVARLDMLLEGTRREEVEQAAAAVKQADAALVELKTSAARYNVRAPRAGIVEALPYELGERPPVGAPVVVMLAEGAPYARVHVPEPRRTQFGPGTKVEVSIDGRDAPLAGEVRFVSAEAAFTPYYALTQADRSRLSFLAEVAITDPDGPSLPTGIPVQVRLASP
jgi:HlyD family secretion protein